LNPGIPATAGACNLKLRHNCVATLATSARIIRLERKHSQETFAEFVGISVDFLSLIEQGMNAPSFETIEHMAKKLRVPVMELFDFRSQDRALMQRKE
jgi:transcriptional regulator with XRE-family HTH domain